jgi:hypothetical protein
MGVAVDASLTDAAGGTMSSSPLVLSVALPVENSTTAQTALRGLVTMAISPN